METDERLAKALRKAIGHCKHCGKHADNLCIEFEDYSLVARCISCGRNSLPSKLDMVPPGDAEHIEASLVRLTKGAA